MASSKYWQIKGRKAESEKLKVFCANDKYCALKMNSRYDFFENIYIFTRKWITLMFFVFDVIGHQASPRGAREKLFQYFIFALYKISGASEWPTIFDATKLMFKIELIVHYI